MNKITKEDLRAMELRFMKSPDEWPRWPILPLQKIGTPREYGFLLAQEGFLTTLFRANFFALTPGWDPGKHEPKEIFESIEALYEAGWRVD